MPRTFYLKGKYEVALAEIQYPHTWNTMREGLDYFIATRLAPNDTPIISVIPKGYYKTIDQLCTTINEIIHEEDDELPIRLKYDRIKRRVYPMLKEHCKISFSDGIAELLGFVPHRWYKKYSEPEHNADVKRGFYTLFVYCSLCEPQVVGDYYVPLLRSVNIGGNDGDVVTKSYTEPHYVPINTSKFDTIEINIKDDTDHNVSFQTGKVVCKLHFRQKAL
jgi:hypothetical protein